MSTFGCGPAAVAQKGLVKLENGTNTVDLVRLEARRQQLKGAGRTLVRVHRHLLQALSGAGARVAALACTRLAGEPMSLTRMATRLAIGKRAVQRHLAGLDGRWIVVGKQLCLDGKTRTTLVV